MDNIAAMGALSAIHNLLVEAADVGKTGMAHVDPDNLAFLLSLVIHALRDSACHDSGCHGD